MPPSFRIQAVLTAKDALTGAANRMFGQVERRGRKAGRSLNKSIGRGIGKGLGAAAKVGGVVAGGGILGGLAGLASVAGDVKDFEVALLDLATQGGLTDAEVGNLRQTIDDVSAATGLSRNRVVEAGNAIVNLEGAAGFSAEKMELLARASIAASAPMDELAGVSFALNNAFFDGSASAAEMEKALSAVLQAGKDGSIPLNEMSQVLQQVATSFDDVTGSGVEGAADLAAALQVSREGFGSAAEAGTGLRNMLTALTKQATRIRTVGGRGIKIFEKGEDGVKRLRPLRFILDDIENSKLAKDPELLTTAFGSQEAAKFVQTLRENRQEWDNLAGAARESTAVQDDFNRKNESSAGRMRRALNEVQLAVEKAFTPERIEAFASVAGTVAEAVARIVTELDKVIKGLEFLTEEKPADKGKGLFEREALARARGGVTPERRRKVEREIAPEGFATPEAAAAAEGLVQEEAKRQQAVFLRREAQRRGIVDESGQASIVAAQRAIQEDRPERSLGERAVATVTGGPRLVRPGLDPAVREVIRGITDAAQRQEKAAEKMERAASALAREQRGGLSHGVR